MVELARSYLKKNRNSSINPRLEKDELSALIIHEEAVKKDETAIKILEEYATYVGFGLANLINLFNPEAILLGGGASRAHKFILPGAKQVVNDRVLKGFKGKCTIIPVEDPTKVPSFGAAKIAINALNG